MNAQTKNSSLIVVSLPCSPAPMFAVLVPNTRESDDIAGQDVPQEERWPRMRRMVSACAGIIALVSTVAILAAG